MMEENGAPILNDLVEQGKLINWGVLTHAWGDEHNWNVFYVAERLTNLDFMDPAREMPFLLQGPFCQVPCQIVALEKHSDGSCGFLMTCSRGYGDSMVGALLKAGAEFGLRPAGENRFNKWVKVIQKKFATV
jgi:hypothetical protein